MASLFSFHMCAQGDFSKRIEALPDEQVQEEVMSVLRSMYPNITLPDPLDFTFPRWHADPLYRGSYSNWPSSFITQHHDNLRANVDRLFFAGEATSQKYFGQFLLLLSLSNCHINIVHFLGFDQKVFCTERISKVYMWHLKWSDV